MQRILYVLLALNMLSSFCTACVWGSSNTDYFALATFELSIAVITILGLIAVLLEVNRR